MTHFRKRLGVNIINEVNEWIVMEEQTGGQDDDDHEGPSSSGEGLPKVVSPPKLQKK